MEIKVCFGFNDNYCQHFACTLASLLYNSRSQDQYTIYAISDYISERNKENIEKLKSIRDFDIEYIDIDKNEYKDYTLLGNLGYQSLYRLKAFERFDFDKVLYLDTDMIVRKDVSELWQTDIEGYYCAGAEDLVAPRKIKEFGLDENTFYINAGMMLLNLEYARQNDVVQQIKDYFEEDWDSSCTDQEMLNYIFQLKIKPVDITWNYTPYPSMYKDQDHFNNVKKDPAILHYIGWQKPWFVDTFPYMKSEYFKYLSMTPFYETFMVSYDIDYRQFMLTKLSDIKNILREPKPPIKYGYVRK